MDKYDIIIIGGSVSGSPTAMLLAKQGHKVLLIEQHYFPRDTNSTHFIWPRGMSYLNRWGLAEKIQEKSPAYRNMEINIEGIKLVGSVPKKDIKNRFEKLHGDSTNCLDLYCGPRRYFLDEILMNAAKDAGVDVREGTIFDSVIIENGTVVGVNATTSDNKKLSAKAKLVIGADGRFSKVANQVGSELIHFRELSTFAYYGYFSGISKVELAIHKKGRLGTAIFPTMTDSHMVLVYGPTHWWNDFRKRAEDNFFKTYEYCAPSIAELIRNGRREERFKSCGQMSGYHRNLYGKGWALIGDSGSFKDQVSAMGITHSFRDSELISFYINKALSSETSMDEAIQEYARVRANDYEAYFNMVCDVAEMNAYSKDDLHYYESIKNNSNQINQLISQFGDTLPLTEGEKPNLINESDLPNSIKNYDPDKKGYNKNIFKFSK